MVSMFRIFKKQSPARLLTLGFFMVILVGGLLLWAPISHNEGQTISLIDAMFVSTSAVCVTGLSTVPVGYTFNVFGQMIIALLIQIGGLGVATFGIILFIVAGKRIGLKTRQLLKEGLNFESFGGLIKTVKIILIIVFTVEFLGAVLSFIVFIRDYPFWIALKNAIFHSISSFNNAGFDVLGGTDSLLMYQDDVFMNLLTAGLVIIGGLGFVVIIDILKNRNLKKLLLQSKVVLFMTFVLLVAGTLLLKMTQDITWLGAFFQSAIARTAGFNTFPLADFSQAGILIMCVLMFIGASPGSTGGGIKTTTFFVLVLKVISSTFVRNQDSVFRRRISNLVISRAVVVMFMGLSIVCTATFLILCLEPDLMLSDVVLETTSAFATVGSSTGITPNLCPLSKFVLMITMFIGRLGPVTVATLLVVKDNISFKYTEETIMIG